MMIFVLFLLLVASASANPPVVFCQTCVKVSSHCHNVTHVLDLPANFRKDVVIRKLEILRSKNILFYSYEPEIVDPEYYKTAFINLDNINEHGVVTNGNATKNFGTFDIDQNNEVVYLGGSDGIYAIHTKNSSLNTTTAFSSRDDDIVSIFYRNNVYFVKTSENKIKQKKGSEFFDHIPAVKIGAVKNFVIDKNYFTIFLNSTGLYVTDRDQTARLSNNAFFRGLTIDLESVVHAWWVDGIYRIILNRDLSKSAIVKIADIPKVGAVTFDNDDNIIFTYGRSLFRLTKTNETVQCP